MPSEVNLLSFDIIFLQTESEILHQYAVFFRCQRNIPLALRHSFDTWMSKSIFP